MEYEDGAGRFGVGEELLPTPEAATSLRVSEHWLHKKRSEGRGPRFIRIGRKVFYRRSDLKEYLESRIVETEDTREMAA